LLRRWRKQSHRHSRDGGLHGVSGHRRQGGDGLCRRWRRHCGVRRNQRRGDRHIRGADGFGGIRVCCHRPTRGFELRAGSEGLDEGEKIAVVDHATQLQLRRDATRRGIPRTGGGAAEEEEKEKARRRSRASWLIYTLDAVVAVWYEPQPGAAAAGGWMGWVGYSSPSFPTRSVRGASRGGLAVPLVGYLALGWVVCCIACKGFTCRWNSTIHATSCTDLSKHMALEFLHGTMFFSLFIWYY
jgi:hypothetical protein